MLNLVGGHEDEERAGLVANGGTQRPDLGIRCLLLRPSSSPLVRSPPSLPGIVSYCLVSSSPAGHEFDMLVYPRRR